MAIKTEVIFVAWNTEKLKEFSEEMRRHNEKYNYPTMPKKKKKSKSTKKDR